MYKCRWHKILRKLTDKDARRSITGGKQIFIYLFSARLISFEINCFLLGAAEPRGMGIGGSAPTHWIESALFSWNRSALVSRTIENY